MGNQIRGICISSHNNSEYHQVAQLIEQLSPNTRIIDFKDVLQDQTLLDECDFMFTIGGDGSVAWLVGTYFDNFHTVKGLKPIVPVVRPESVGYLKQLDLNPGIFEIGFTQIMEGHYTVQDRTVLKTTISGKSYVAVNELYLMTSPHLSKFRVDLKYDNDTYHPMTSTMADGAMVVTSLGSTGWALSYKGQISLDEDALELIFVGGVHSSANFTLPRKPIRLAIELKNETVTQETIDAYHRRRKELRLSQDKDAEKTLNIIYGSRLTADGKVIAFGVDDVEIDSTNSIPFVFLYHETVVDKARKLTRFPNVKE